MEKGCFVGVFYRGRKASVFYFCAEGRYTRDEVLSIMAVKDIHVLKKAETCYLIYRNCKELFSTETIESSLTRRNDVHFLQPSGVRYSKLVWKKTFAWNNSMQWVSTPNNLCAAQRKEIPIYPSIEVVIFSILKFFYQ